MEPLPHGLWSCSSKPLTGRTGQAEGRFSYWKHHEPQPVPQEYSRTRTRLMTTCLVGHPSIEATTTPATGTTRPSRKPTPRRRLLRIAHPLDTNDLSPGHPPLLRTGHSMAKKLTPIDTECHHGPHTLAENTSHVKCFSSTDHIF